VGLLAAMSADAGTAGCDQGPHTSVVLANGYAPSATPLVVYRAYWQNIAFPTPIDPGSSAAAQPAEPTSGDTAYVLLAPGWDPELAKAPTSLIVLQSRVPISATFNQQLTIAVDDTTFAGNCLAGSPLSSQAQADFITQVVFPCEFTMARYDAATCTLTPSSQGSVACEDGGL
jgi:hypothetical protein